MLGKFFIRFIDNIGRFAVSSFYTAGETLEELIQNSLLITNRFDSVSKCKVNGEIVMQYKINYTPMAKIYTDSNVCEKGVYQLGYTKSVYPVISIIPSPISDFVSSENKVSLEDIFDCELVGKITNSKGEPTTAFVKSLYKLQHRG